MGSAASTAAKTPRAMVALIQGEASKKSKEFGLLEQETTGKLEKLRLMVTEDPEFEEIFLEMSGALSRKLKDMDVAAIQMEAQQETMEKALLDARDKMTAAKADERRLDQKQKRAKTDLARAKTEKESNDQIIRSNEARMEQLKKERKEQQENNKKAGAVALGVGLFAIATGGLGLLALGAVGAAGGIAVIDHQQIQDVEKKVNDLKARRSTLAKKQNELQSELRSVEASFDDTKKAIAKKQKDYGNCEKTALAFGKLKTSIVQTKVSLKKVLTKAKIDVEDRVNSLDAWRDYAELGEEPFNEQANLLLTGLKDAKISLDAITTDLKHLQPQLAN